MTQADYSGARGSNAGDQFHELWALLQVLELLRVNTSLKAVGVEGVKVDPPASVGGSTWEGVDVTLYHGGQSLGQADHLELVQLKYSGADPGTEWTVARLTYSTAKASNNSVLRKMARDYINAKSSLKAGATITFRFLSNQNISQSLSAVLNAKWSGSLDNSGLSSAVIDDLKKLHLASGLSIPEFAEFLTRFDASECGENSRFKMQESIVDVVQDYLGDDVSSEVRELRTRVRDLMMPERVDEVITEKDVLLWFDISSREGLFPSEPDIPVLSNAVKRPAAGEVLRQLQLGHRIVVLHGVGGAGKTTLMRQVTEGLPQGSVSVHFDCFGGGRYIYSDDKRHLPEKAFLQITNEVAVALRIPIFIPRDIRHPASIGIFLKRLTLAGRALEKLAPIGLLTIIIDAADNSIMAAEAAIPTERSFVQDILSANLDALPSNVRFVISSRTSRLEKLRIPQTAADVPCPLFDRAETKAHLETILSAPSDELVEQFHELSHRNPRVQSYAISIAKTDMELLLDVLRPGGKTLPDVLKLTFDSALKKLGQNSKFDEILAALAFLPAPANVAAISRVTATNEGTIQDFALDLSPGLRLHDNAVSIADEDFENYIKKSALSRKGETEVRIAEDFYLNHKTDSYCALHVADMLLATKQVQQLLEILEGDPKVEAIKDPVLRRQVQLRRLWLGLAGCRETKSSEDALRIVLISAEAEKDESTLSQILEKEIDLATEFSGPSLRRMILLDRDRVDEHGAFLAHDAARAGRAGDNITAREQLHFFRAWLRRRNEVQEEKRREWSIEDRDVAARAEAVFYLAGPEAAYRDLTRWRPREVPLRAAKILVPRLVAAGKTAELRALVVAGLALVPIIVDDVLPHGHLGQRNVLLDAGISRRQVVP
ncbi:MAG: hypothetical protein KG075_02880 [Alphaproteobacteria bacterium]|nr:hypothetical protein [Alphaproteobacteria bacterium]